MPNDAAPVIAKGEEARAAAMMPLCEGCGYDIGGISADLPCPECGRSVASSLAVSRAGTAWQTAPSLRAWVETNAAVLWSPTKTFERMRLGRDRCGLLLIINIVVASAMLVTPWTGVLAVDPVRRAFSRGWLEGIQTALLMVPAQIAAVCTVLLALTLIEFMGVRFIAERRGWRLTRRAAWRVCCHASVGWIVLALMPIMSLVVQYVVVVRPIARVPPEVSAWLGRTWGVTLNDVVMVVTPAIAIIAGIFVFELLVYRGVRACRYAADLPDRDVTA
jgi:predicted RNA-binding Zn-ribbon protein involved in translation (DUF1610 family)